MKFKPLKETSIELLISKLGATIGSSVMAHQLIYLMEPQYFLKERLSISQKLFKNWQATRRPMEQTSAIFCLKVATDYLEEKMESRWS
jgi:hypothetical protein